jgi:addiction module HigA family antidote
METNYFPPSVPHPGEILAEKLEEWGMGAKEFAVRTGKPEKTILAVLSGKSAITPEMAVQFENVTRIAASFWLNLQRGYDESMARKKRAAVVRAAEPWAKKFPVEAMTRKGWIPVGRTWEHRSSHLLAFFGFSQHTVWEAYYTQKQLKVAFRLSLEPNPESYAVSAWLRQGELQASELQCRPYSKALLQKSLPDIQVLIGKKFDDPLFLEIQNLALKSGVKVIQTSALPKAPLVGCTRWINQHPVIQLTNRFKNPKQFWFTFFHEIGHLVLHGKKDIFLENLEYTDKDLLKEQEADAFAKRWVGVEEK